MMFGFSWQGLILVLLPLLPNLVFFLLPAPVTANKLKDGGLFINIIEHGGRIVFYILMIFLINKNPIPGQVFFSIGMGACLLVYLILWGRYFFQGRKFNLLFDKVIGIPIPMAIFPIFFYLFSTICLGNYFACLALAIFAVGHIINSWITYIQIR